MDLVIAGADARLFQTAHDEALRSMPSAWADAYILTDLRGTSTVEAASLLGVPQQTVSWHASQARSRIREEILT